jgi:hypothetical protein
MTEYGKWDALCSRIARSCDLTRTGHNVLLVAGFSDDAKRNAPLLQILQCSHARLHRPDTARPVHLLPPDCRRDPRRPCV